MVHQYNPRIVQAQMEGTSPGFWTILVLNVKLCRPTLFFYDSMEHVVDAEKCNSSCFFLSTRSHFLPVTPEGWRVRTGTTLVRGRWPSEVVWRQARFNIDRHTITTEYFSSFCHRF